MSAGNLARRYTPRLCCTKKETRKLARPTRGYLRIFKTFADLARCSLLVARPDCCGRYFESCLGCNDADLLGGLSYRIAAHRTSRLYGVTNGVRQSGVGQSHSHSILHSAYVARHDQTLLEESTVHADPIAHRDLSTWYSVAFFPVVRAGERDFGSYGTS